MITTKLVLWLVVVCNIAYVWKRSFDWESKVPEAISWVAATSIVAAIFGVSVSYDMNIKGYRGNPYQVLPWVFLGTTFLSILLREAWETNVIGSYFPKKRNSSDILHLVNDKPLTKHMFKLVRITISLIGIISSILTIFSFYLQHVADKFSLMWVLVSVS